MRRLIRLLALLEGYVSYCSRCGAGPYNEAELAGHMASAHGQNY